MQALEWHERLITNIFMQVDKLTLWQLNLPLDAEVDEGRREPDDPIALYEGVHHGGVANMQVRLQQ